MVFGNLRHMSGAIPPVMARLDRIGVEQGGKRPIPSWSAKAGHPRLAVLAERKAWKMVGLRPPRR
jgi:hypothetical protein